MQEVAYKDLWAMSLWAQVVQKPVFSNEDGINYRSNGSFLP